MKKSSAARKRISKEERLFCAEGAYAESIVRTALGDHEASFAALQQALAWKPDYAPAILSLGSVEYQLGRRAEGRKLFEPLLSLPEDTPDLCQIIDEAGEFLIHFDAYEDGLALYRATAGRFPNVAALHDGLSCCAGHEGAHDEAIAAAERAMQLEPDSQKFVNDLGWSLLLAGRLNEAARILKQAVSMDPTDG
jgi:tetratricopeptide (TPR) repeat protein